MNTATTETGTSGDEFPRPDPGGIPASWTMAAGEWDDESLQDCADLAVTPAMASASGIGLAPHATDQQFAAWIDAIVDQDERALAAFYDATFSRVFGIVQCIVRRAALAEEVVEDTYFQVWRQAVRFDPARGQVLTWLLAIARSRALDALRRDMRARHVDLDDETECGLVCEARPTDELLDIARHQADLHKALLLLGAQPRQLVSLAFFRGLSHEEIAVQTNLPLGTVKSQIRRALLALRQALGDGGLAALAS